MLWSGVSQWRRGYEAWKLRRELALRRQREKFHQWLDWTGAQPSPPAGEEPCTADHRVVSTSQTAYEDLFRLGIETALDSATLDWDYPPFRSRYLRYRRRRAARHGSRTGSR